jgi:hypothetical protein
VTDTERVSVHRNIAAPAADIYRLITDPQMHVKIDGSGMLMAAPDARALAAVGDTFEMDMDREALGDIPMGKYQVINTVTKISPNQWLEWNVGTADYKPIGHVYGYELKALSDHETEVTSYCDWSNLSEKMRGRVSFPVVPVTALVRSLENLDRLALSPTD